MAVCDFCLEDWFPFSSWKFVLASVILSFAEALAAAGVGRSILPSLDASNVSCLGVARQTVFGEAKPFPFDGAKLVETF